MRRKLPKALVACAAAVVVGWAAFYARTVVVANEWRVELDKSLEQGRVTDSHFHTIRWHFGRTFDLAWSEPYDDGTQLVEKPEEWQPAFVELSVAIGERDWLAAADSLAALEQMLPSPIIENNPWSEDLRHDLLAGRAQMLLFAREFNEAERACNALMNATSANASSSVARENAHLILAQIHSARGDYARALDAFEQSQSANWSGCGNCNEGQEQQASAVRQVYEACTLPEAQATKRLLAIRRGQISVRRGPLTGTNSGYQRILAWTEATMALAQFALNRGDEETAKKYLMETALSTATHNDSRNTALAWLATLGMI